jgi:hypothetical protein
VRFLVILLLTGCASATPLTTTVSKGQEYEMPESGVIIFKVADEVPCGDYGCTVNRIGDVFEITVLRSHARAMKHFLEHELEHVVYGPNHIED